MTKKQKLGVFWLIVPFVLSLILVMAFQAMSYVLVSSTEEITKTEAATSDHLNLIMQTEGVAQWVFLGVGGLVLLSFVYGIPRGLYLLIKDDVAAAKEKSAASTNKEKV